MATKIDLQTGGLSIANMPDSNVPNRFRFKAIECDFFDTLSASNISPFLSTAIASGSITINASLADANHPGNNVIVSSASANSGAILTSGYRGLLIAGGELATFIWYQDLNTDTTFRIGLHDANTSSDATDGAYFEIVAGSLTGKTASNSTRSTTGTSYATSATTWYRGTIEINSDATLVTFTLYNSATNAVLWTDTLATNIPTGAGRNCGMSCTATQGTGTTASLLTLDYASLFIARTLTR